MALALLLARLVLSAVFLVSGIAKLMDRPGSRKAVEDFGVHAALAGPSAILLPVAELTVAVALLVRASAWYGALGALLLLLLFVAGISVNMARGRAPDCHCFGQLHSEPVGWRTLARNGVLIVIAAFVAWRGRTDAGLSTTGWLTDRTGFERAVVIAGLIGLVLFIAQGWLLLHLLEQHGRLLIRLDEMEARGVIGGVAPAAPVVSTVGLPVGTPAPTFALAGLYGETLTLDALRASGKPTLLLFTDPNCGPCNALLPTIGRWQREMTATLALISRGAPEANRAKSTEHGLTHVLLQRDREVAESYQSTATPSAVLVQPDGTVGSPIAIGADAITQLVAGITETPLTVPAPMALPVIAAQGNAPCPNCGQQQQQMAPTALGIGERAPAIRLPNLTGKTVTLDSYRGSNTLVLFWNPGCGFCSAMLDDLKAWETSAPKGAPKLLVVSTGAAETNKVMGLHATVLLDQTFSVAPTFGVSGTPSAVLVDAKGVIASGVAVGKDAVLALASANQDQARAISF
ncbi:MAG: MauE/DoxX family redox-associated membrane protein [Thermomicrobiales bacterium]